MSIRRIREIGDPVLRSKAIPVTDFDASLRRLVEDLEDTLIEADGAGLAAPQIGAQLRAFVYVDVDRNSPAFGEVRHMVNPVIVEASEDDVIDEEGCLSIPGLAIPTPRPRRIVATGFDENGEPLRVEGTDRLARALAHETDHLDGVLFIDRLDPAERKRAMGLIRELKQQGQDVAVKLSPHGGRVG